MAFDRENKSLSQILQTERQAGNERTQTVGMEVVAADDYGGADVVRWDK